MLDNFFINNFLERYPDYKLHPCNFNLRPDKIKTFSMGLTTSPEGWWDCTMYWADGKDYKDWLEICWEIENTEDSKIYFWIKILSYIGTHEDGHIRPSPLKSDAFRVEIVDHSIEGSMGWGKEWKSSILYSIDDVFKFIKEHHLLSEFFFTKKEKENLKLDLYVDR